MVTKTSHKFTISYQWKNLPVLNIIFRKEDWIINFQNGNQSFHK